MTPTKSTTNRHTEHPMDLKQIADTLQIPLVRLTTGRQGPPKLKLIRGGKVDKHKQPE